MQGINNSELAFVTTLRSWSKIALPAGEVGLKAVFQRSMFSFAMAVISITAMPKLYFTSFVPFSNDIAKHNNALDSVILQHMDTFPLATYHRARVAMAFIWALTVGSSNSLPLMLLPVKT